MIDTFESHNSRDFSKRYLGSWGYYKQSDEKRTFVLMKEVRDDRVVFIDADQTSYQAVADQGVKFEFISAKKRLFVHMGDLCFIVRRPAKQWARGINNANTRIENVTTGKRDTGLTFPKMVAAVDMTSIDVLKAVSEFEQGRIRSMALSNQFGVTNDRLYLYDQEVGTWDASTKTIKVTELMFRQEILDLVAKHAIDYQVTT